MKNAHLLLRTMLAAGAVTTAIGLCRTANAQGESRAYLVRSAHGYQQACFPPCRCSLDWRDDLIGHFTLTRGVNDPRFTSFAVTNAHLEAPALDRVYTGSGDYRIGGGSEPIHQLALDLSFGDTQEHYDSGLVPVSGVAGVWPVIVLEINQNGRVCHDTVFSIVASRVADWNASGERTLEDLFAFLLSYFGGSGDADGNGVTNVGDVFVFLADYFDPA